MRITKSRLREIIKEEIETDMSADRRAARAKETKRSNMAREWGRVRRAPSLAVDDETGKKLSFENWLNKIVKLSGFQSFDDLPDTPEQDIDYYEAWLSGWPPISMVGVR